MIRSFFVFLCSCIYFNSHMQAVEEVTYFHPTLYKAYWPDFCLEHLKQYPLECSEHTTDATGREVPSFLENGSSSFHVDTEIVEYLLDDLEKIPTKNLCHFAFCSTCQTPRLRQIFQEEYEDYYDWEDVYYVVREKCLCSSSWEEMFWDEDSCRRKSPPSIYFDVPSKQFVHFLKQHLKYSQENSDCFCYWPYLSKGACEISDLIYKKMEDAVYNTALSGLCRQKKEDVAKEFPYLISRSESGVVLGLFTHAFFYSQYREILFKLKGWIDTRNRSDWDKLQAKDEIYQVIDTIQPLLLDLYSNCLDKHPHPKIYYERGMVLLHQGKALESLNDIQKFTEWAEKENAPDLLSSDLYLQEGVASGEIGLYVDILTLPKGRGFLLRLAKESLTHLRWVLASLSGLKNAPLHKLTSDVLALKHL